MLELRKGKPGRGAVRSAPDPDHDLSMSPLSAIHRRSLATGVLLLALGSVHARPGLAQAAASSDWLALLPEGEPKRQFIIDCTNCHQMDEPVTLLEGRDRTRDEWAASVRKMLGFAGATTGFPIISAGRDPEATATWLTLSLAGRRPAPRPVATATAEVTEYPMPVAEDLPHDVAVDSTGGILITGMFSHVMYRMDPGSGAMTRIELPAPRGGPRAVEVDGAGNWWVLLGGPGLMARYTPATARWDTWPMGMYPHSVALDRAGGAWFNGHFTRDPEQVGRVDPGTGRVELHAVPPHPTMAQGPGGPIPYELRAAPDGTIWGSELQGNRIFRFSPDTRRFRAWSLPTPMSAPRRFDITADGVLWIPAYAAGVLVRFDPRTERFTEIPLPLTDALPYVVRADPRREQLWIGTAGADLVFRYDLRTGAFSSYRLPSPGALVRHLAVDPANGDVWLAYGASPSRIGARIARLRPR